MRVIELDPAETFYSLRDRILRGERERIVLVVPTYGGALRGGVDLPLLRRLADRERLEIGLVTTDRDLARQAWGVGLPAFSSLLLAQHYRPGWWRGRRRSERLGQPDRVPPADPAGGAAVIPFAVGLILLAAALVVASAFYFLPHATITLRPASQPAQVIVEMTDVPTRAVRLDLPWETSGPGTNASARQSVRALALQALGTGADGLLAARLAPDERLVSGSTQVTVAGERARTVGGETHLSLTAELTGAAVSASEINRRVLPELARALPSGYVIDPVTLVSEIEATSAADRLVVTARATGRATIDTAALAARLAGQRVKDVGPLLSTLPLAEPASLDQGFDRWAFWFHRLPLRAERIRVELLP